MTALFILCSFLADLKGECVRHTVMDRCVEMKDMRADPVCNALGHYVENEWTAYVNGKLVARR